MKSNINVLNQVEEKKDSVKVISGKMCGHLLRHNPFLTNIFEGRINGHKEEEDQGRHI